MPAYLSPLTLLSRGAGIVALTALLAGCGSDGPTTPPEPIGNAVAFGIWTPTARETCTKEQHDKYAVVGPDRKLYPTWHPPNDPATGCSFGHEHGRDPRGSRLYASVGDIPLGFANEQLDIYDPNGQRREDHVGHKIEWENGVKMRVNNPVASAIIEVTCDVLIKMHQGTHSKDAFTNNLHEMVYHIRCNDGTEAHLTFMAAIGTPGEFVRSCDGARVTVGPATPANSPRGGGQRIIPDKFCVDQFMLVGAGKQSDFGRGVHESWQTSTGISTEDGHTLASLDPYFQVDLPSRFYDPAAPNITGRTIDICTMVESNGDRARGGACQESTQNGTITGLTFDDPRSEFNGVERVFDVNSIRINNADGPSVWYTDPFGRKGRLEPFAGSIRQVISKVNNGGLGISGPGLGHNRHYGGPGVHAPN